VRPVRTAAVFKLMVGAAGCVGMRRF